MSERPLKVKVSTSFPSWPLQDQLPNRSTRLGNVEFIIDQKDPECDFWIVFDDVLETEQGHCAPENTLFLTGEPPSIKTYTKSFLTQFSTIITCHPNLPHPHVVRGQQGHPWHVGKNYDSVSRDLQEPKTKLLSIISSNKKYSSGHRARINFANKVVSVFGSKVELFGRGIRPFNTKWEVLAPYKYTIAIENDVLPDWITEKLPDCWLAECYPLYFGAPNANKYYPSGAFTQIDIYKPNLAMKTIASLIENASHYQTAVSAIREAKRRYLDTYSFFPLLSTYTQKLFRINATKRTVTLKPMNACPTHWLERQKNTLKVFLAAK